MNKLLFIMVREDGTRLKMEMPSDSSYPDICIEFGHFLKGCGFYFDGTVQVVNEEELSQRIPTIKLRAMCDDYERRLEEAHAKLDVLTAKLSKRGKK